MTRMLKKGARRGPKLTDLLRQPGVRAKVNPVTGGTRAPAVPRARKNPSRSFQPVKMPGGFQPSRSMPGPIRKPKRRA